MQSPVGSATLVDEETPIGQGHEPCLVHPFETGDLSFPAAEEGGDSHSLATRAHPERLDLRRVHSRLVEVDTDGFGQCTKHCDHGRMGRGRSVQSVGHAIVLLEHSQRLAEF